ncbi:MAG: DUF6970 domain-containing protein [Candidatus Dadabacteria bacterium]
MNLRIAVIILACLTSATCNKLRVTVPPCIEQKINTIKAQPKWNPPAQVDEYMYKGQIVYLFSGNCCDQYNELYDASCTYLCAPSGGITGKGDGKCTDFSTAATLVRTIWKDNR